MEAPNLFNYLDYRKYLADFVTFKKADQGKFRYIDFSRAAGLASPNYLKLVIDGKKNLSISRAETFAKLCQLNSKEIDYFITLVKFNQSKEITERENLISRLHRKAKRLDEKVIKDDQYEFLSTWYHSVIRLMATLKGFRADPAYIAKRLWFLISSKEARESLDFLINSGFLYKEDGKFKLADRHITSHDEVVSSAVQNFHSQMIPLGVKAIELSDISKREMRATTLSINKEQIPVLKEKVKQFHQDMVKLSEERPGAQSVYQLNTQFFQIIRD